MPPHPLTNFEIQRYYQSKPKFTDVYSRNNLSKIEDVAYVINLDEYESIGTHWIVSEFFQKIQKKLENSLKIKHYREYL